jgi:hypothetical protein
MDAADVVATTAMTATDATRAVGAGRREGEGDIERAGVRTRDRSAPRSHTHPGNELPREPDVSPNFPVTRAVGAPVASLNRG